MPTDRGAGKSFVGLVALALLTVGCTSIDSSTSKALDLCKSIRNEEVRSDCIVRVAKEDPDR